jgi:Peptidase family S41
MRKREGSIAPEIKHNFSFGGKELVKGISRGIKSQFAGTETLRTFLSLPGELSFKDRQLLIDQALVLLEMFYVHMPLKRAMHAIDPVQQLRLIRYHLNQRTEVKSADEIQFHNEMTKVFTSLRDLHTNYILPSPFKEKIAILPFQIEEFYEGQRKYLVSRTVPGFNHPTFKPGVEVLYWNGIPIDRAVEINSNSQAGSNLEARHAQGLDSLTFRPLMISTPPDEEWVVIGYRSLDGQDLELKQNWLVSPVTAFGGADPNSLTKKAAALGIDIKTHMIQQMKKTLFAPKAAIAEENIAKGKIKRAAPAAGLETSMPTVFKALSLDTPSGRYGYIRIFTFNVENDDEFIAEFIRLAESLPETGLIIDVRGNGGGLIFASERLLQILTPHHIKPEPAQFINTPLTLELCRRNQADSETTLDLSAWLGSMEQAVEIGANYSQGVPITSEEACNSIGQRYHGPVILITDALCYSATDIFAAGFQDNNIGPILGTNGNTGAGGANVWTHELLRILMGKDSPLKPLKNSGDMRVSIRRMLRVIDHEGMPLEDLGVTPDYRHEMTREDLLNGNVDLISKAASILAQMPAYKLFASIRTEADGKLKVDVETKNINRLDLFIDYRPRQSIDLEGDSARFEIESPKDASFVELRGYKDSNLVAVRKVEIE